MRRLGGQKSLNKETLLHSYSPFLLGHALSVKLHPCIAIPDVLNGSTDRLSPVCLSLNSEDHLIYLLSHLPF